MTAETTNKIFWPWFGLNETHWVVFDSLHPYGLHSLWNSPDQNIGVGSLSLLQGIFPTQGLNPGLLHCRQILNQLSHKGSPKTLEWVAYPFSRGSSRPRNPTRVSCIAGGFFTNWAYEGSPDKQKLKGFSTIKPALQQILKEIIQAENKRKALPKHTHTHTHTHTQTKQLRKQ